MTTIIRKSACVGVSVSAHDMITPNKEQMILDHLRNYEGTCFDGCFVREIKSVICGIRKFTSNGEGMMPVIFEFMAEIIPDDNSVIIHNCVVGKVMDTTQNHVVLTCTSGSNISVSALINRSGIIIPGMIIPVRCFSSSYPQNAENKINVFGEVLLPQKFVIEMAVLAPAENEIDNAQKMINDIKDMATAISEKPRSQYFRSWLYPHKETEEHNENINATLTKKWSKVTYIKIDDWCDQTNMEYKKIKGRRTFDSVTFTEFIKIITGEAKKTWTDIDMLCTTYASEDVYKRHAMLFKYYEDAKDTADATTDEIEAVADIRDEDQTLT